LNFEKKVKNPKPAGLRLSVIKKFSAGAKREVIKMASRNTIVAFCIFFSFIFSCAAHAAQVTLAWDRNTQPGITGYKVYWGPHASEFPYSMDVGDVTTYTVTGLVSGETVCFAATDYTDSELESGYSNVVCTIPGGIKYPFADFFNTLCDGVDYDPVKTWVIRPINPRDYGSTFKQGSTPYLLSVLERPSDFFQIEQVWIRNGKVLMSRSTGPQYPELVWDQGYLFSFIKGINSGDWQVETYLTTTAAGYELREVIDFNIDNSAPFGMGLTGTGKSAVNGIAIYSRVLVDSKTAFAVGERVQGLFEGINMFVDHRWQVKTYRNNVLYWTWTQADFNIVDPDWGWIYSYFEPWQISTQAGNYRYDVLLDTGAGFQAFASRSFTVSAAALAPDMLSAEQTAKKIKKKKKPKLPKHGARVIHPNL
jgi:hypothetical protein